jgi:hypothetical protein
MIRPYKSGGWVIVELYSDREVIIFENVEEAEKTCQIINQEVSQAA